MFLHPSSGVQETVVAATGMVIHSVDQNFSDWIFYRFPTTAIYRAAIDLCSWNRFSQECKLALVQLQLLLRQNVSH
jgi:hypothetical protein